MLPAVIALAGGVVGLLVGFLIEHALDWRAKSDSLANQVVELERELEGRERERKLLEHRARVAQAESGINEIWMKIYSDAFTELQKTGHALPMSAMLARAQLMQEVKGLDKPVPPPDL